MVVDFSHERRLKRIRTSKCHKFVDKIIIGCLVGETEVGTVSGFVGFLGGIRDVGDLPNLFDRRSICNIESIGLSGIFFNVITSEVHLGIVKS
ncbi:hypothetical protein SDC9_179798 [bioreactor metagenome]|uniref:Uncharacterized protein n=1 Tax=bioreactor metagenome TaxID=1076179 RepID=A0A645H0V3_9ZZZZ